MSPVRPTVQLVGTQLDPDAHRVRGSSPALSSWPQETRAVARPSEAAGAVGEGAMAVALVHRRLDELALVARG
jgi:hypothetical protein